MGGLLPRPVPSSLYQINGQCTNHYIAIIIYDGPLLCGCNVAIKLSSSPKRELYQRL